MKVRPKILVVDDDEPLLQLMRNILTEFKFDPMLASTGTFALELARRDPPELILVDKNMPVMSGDELIRAFRNDPLLHGTPILVLSGEPLSPGELSELGADGAVQKPFELSRLLAAIRGHMAPPAMETKPKTD